MPKKTKSEETYQEGLDLENKKEYTKAYDKFKEVKNQSPKTYTACQLAIARLCLQRKINTEGNACPSEVDYYEQGLDYLESLNLDKDNIKEESHAELDKCLKALKSIDETKLSPNYQTKRLFLLAKLNYLFSKSGAKYLEELSLAIDKNSDKAVAAFAEYIEKGESKKVLSDFAGKKISTEDLSVIDISKCYLYFKLLHKVLTSKKESSGTGSPIKTPPGSNFFQTMLSAVNLTDEQVKKYQESMVLLCERIVMGSNNFKCIAEAINYLKNKNIGLTDVQLKRCFQLLESASELSEEEEQDYYYCCCLIGGYIIGQQPDKGAGLIEKSLNKISSHAEYANFRKILEKYYQDSNLSDKLNELNSFGISDPGSIFAKAEEEWKKWEGSKDPEALKLAIQLYKTAALNQHVGAAKKIKSLVENFDEDKLVPEVLMAYADLLNSLSSKDLKNLNLYPGEKKKVKKLTTKKEKDAYINKLHVKARNIYENILKDKELQKNRPDIFRELAKLRYKGELFEKNHHFARYLLGEAEANSDMLSYYEHARMCFYGEGGAVDIAKAKLLLEKIDLIKVCNKAEVLYLKAEILYLEYLRARDQMAAQKMIDYYAEAVLLGHKNALLSLFIMHQYDHDPMATTKLAELYYKHRQEVPLLKSVVFSGFPETTDAYHLHFCAMLHQQNRLPGHLYVPGLKEFLLEKEKDKQKQFARIQELLDQFKKIEDEFEVHQTMNELIVACENNPELKQKVIAMFEEYYKNTEDGVNKLLTTLCYESMRHEPKENMDGFKSHLCQVFFEVLCNLAPKYKTYNRKQLQEELTKIEKREKNYFDECLSEDSDDEAEKKYQGSDKHHTADVSYNKPLISKIAEEAKKQIESIEKLNENKIDDKKYNKYVGDIKQLFGEPLQQSLLGKRKRNAVIDPKEKSKIEQDLQTLNHYSAMGKLEEGLRRVSTPFAVAEARGLHFYTTKWSQKQRRNFWRNIKHENHPYLNAPLYSSAVYDRAGVTDFSDYNETTQLRLEKVAKFIQNNLVSMPDQPYTLQDNVLPQTFFQRAHKSRHMQFQQLYSNNYAGMHDLLKKEKQNPQSFIVSDKNPMVSMGDLNSCHPHYYAYGNKTYQIDDESERLRPRYLKGRSLRPHSGFVEFTLHPLGDFARKGHHHVPSLNFKHEIWVDWTIVPELECSVYSFVDRDRLVFIHPARFPSFHHANYPKVFLHSYGIDEQLYYKFQKLIKESAPHSNKQRLAILLLGQYLSAYQTIYYMRYIQDKAERLGYILLFRDQHGNFSFKPCFDFSPNPNGDEDRLRLRRHFSGNNANANENNDVDMSEEENDNTPPSPKRQRTNTQES